MTMQSTVLAYVERHVNTWLSVDEIARGVALHRRQVRGALTALRIKKLVLCSLDTPWLGRAPGGRWRSKAGFLANSRFAPRQRPEAIFIAPGGEERDELIIVGPFCVHCGNPLSVHGPERECLNYRIHPLLPSGDLPRARA